LVNLNNLLDSANCDSLLVSEPANVRYLSGFTTPKDGKVLINRNGATLVTDGRYIVQAGQESRIPVRIMKQRNELPAICAELLHGKVGFEADHLTVGVLSDLQGAAPREWVATRGLLEQIRRVKSADELNHIRAATQLANRAYGHVLGLIEPGIREMDVAMELERYMRSEGSEGSLFVAVVSGPRTAMPHGVATNRRIEPGDLVTIDLGAVVQGYTSDMTRTFGVGDMRPELVRLYEAVLAAQEAALQAVAPGKSGKELDTIARDLLTDRGYGEYFAHSLGHGVGLFIHEGPSLSQISTDVLQAGMVVTIEPGAYIPGLGGVRVEDLAIVTPTGHEVLTTPSKAWLSL
jgi:Xaa-Pro aminopeptidase